MVDGYEVQLTRSDGTATLALIGDIDLAAEALVRAKAQEAISLAPTDIVVDLSASTFLDSAGISALVTLANEAAERSCPVTMRRGPSNVMRVLDITGMGDLFPELD